MSRHKACRSGNRAFTLVELLVVIGIIAILISVLLPSLSAAKRAGAKVKCAAALHQLGDAFKMYSIDSRGWWPIMKWAPDPTKVPANAPKVMSWQDYLFPYLHKGTALPLATLAGDTGSGGGELRSDLGALRGNSPLWGCPAFRGELYYNPTNDTERYSTGYGMSYHPGAPYPSWGYTLSSPGIEKMCIYEYSTGSGYKGRFYKHVEWIRRGSERGVLADSNWFWMWTNPREPFKANFSCDPFFDGSAGSTFMRVDGARHLAPPYPRAKVLGNAGINMLFADGHVTPVTPFEAYNATMGGGTQILK